MLQIYTKKWIVMHENFNNLSVLTECWSINSITCQVGNNISRFVSSLMKSTKSPFGKCSHFKVIPMVSMVIWRSFLSTGFTAWDTMTKNYCFNTFPLQYSAMLQAMQPLSTNVMLCLPRLPLSSGCSDKAACVVYDFRGCMLSQEKKKKKKTPANEH